MGLDLELKLLDSNGTKFSDNNDQLNQISYNVGPILYLGTRYVISYNDYNA